jgi:opacity protein-like surface antigen
MSRIFLGLALLALGLSSARAATVTQPGPLVLNALDVATVTTGGTAVTAINAGHRSAGGWIQNPPSATINLCIAEVGVASGTVTAGNTVCIIPGQSYTVAPSSGSVSVISSDSAHPFGGYGLQ